LDTQQNLQVISMSGYDQSMHIEKHGSEKHGSEKHGTHYI
jgi:hypothetical protein